MHTLIAFAIALWRRVVPLTAPAPNGAALGALTVGSAVDGARDCPAQTTIRTDRPVRRPARIRPYVLPLPNAPQPQPHDVAPRAALVRPYVLKPRLGTAGDGLDDLRAALGPPLRTLIAQRPDLAYTPRALAGVG